MEDRTPLHSLLFLLLVGLLGLVTMLVFPKDGISLYDTITLQYESPNDFFGEEIEEDTLAFVVDSLLSVEGVDSVAIRDSLEHLARLHYERVTGIQHADSTYSSLNIFYEALVKLKSQGGKVRILHYGDSQLEGDRMTRYIRNELQKEYGGIGPGLLPVYKVIPTSGAWQDHSDNWLRYAAYGPKDTTINHHNYGFLASFSRFMPPPDTLTADTTVAWLHIQPSKIGFSRVKKFNRLKLLLGGNTKPINLQITADSTEVYNQIIDTTELNRVINVPFASTPEDIQIVLEGTDSPNLYGLSLEGNSGIIMDNIPLRGSSGTLFRGINYDLLKEQYDPEPIRLVILQFGGNTVPYAKSKERVAKFESYFKANLRYMKALIPNASFIVLGPSDMSTKVKDKFETHPLLESVRDAIQKAAHEEGMAYYDFYEVMGGKNSMPEWVNADPPLAVPDYVHFTFKGARKIAKLFYAALMKDYHRYSNPTPDTLKTDSTYNAN
ncbi:MAG: GDSL-type esterase/lipase family protein [Bacteroidota bacterium]